jgi:hypothetical protein
MAPEHVREIEERWPAIGAGVENGKQRLEEAIQVDRWNYVAAELQQVVARVPPVMTNACGQDYSAPGWHDDLFPSDSSAESSRFHNALLPFTNVHVQRRAVRFGRQRAIEVEDDSSLRVTPAVHPQDLSGTAVLQRQKVIHDSIPFGAYQLRKQLRTNLIIGGRVANTQIQPPM